jgi:integrase
VHHTFAQLTSALGLRNATIRPRIHDFRHSFAVRTLINWHRAGVDTGAHMAVLSNYLGHVRPASTYWYLTAAPELMELAAARLQTGPGVHR